MDLKRQSYANVLSSKDLTRRYFHHLSCRNIYQNCLPKNDQRALHLGYRADLCLISEEAEYSRGTFDTVERCIGVFANGNGIRSSKTLHAHEKTRDENSPKDPARIREFLIPGSLVVPSSPSRPLPAPAGILRPMT